MPRIILKKPPNPPEHDRLVRRLAQELRSPGNGLLPLIIEQEIEVTCSRHVHVIWDRWKNISQEQRSDVIWEAYSQVEGDKAEEITIASGATPAEAVVLGLLPYKVVSTRRRHETKPPPADYQKAIKAEAKKTVLGQGADELRYPRLEDAEEAKTRLEKKVPGWAVVQEVPYEG